MVLLNSDPVEILLVFIEMILVLVESGGTEIVGKDKVLIQLVVVPFPSFENFENVAELELTSVLFRTRCVDSSSEVSFNVDVTVALPVNETLFGKDVVVEFESDTTEVSDTKGAELCSEGPLVSSVEFAVKKLAELSKPLDEFACRAELEVIVSDGHGFSMVVLSLVVELNAALEVLSEKTSDEGDSVTLLSFLLRLSLTLTVVII